MMSLHNGLKHSRIGLGREEPSKCFRKLCFYLISYGLILILLTLWLPAKAAIYIIAEVYVVRLEHLCV